MKRLNSPERRPERDEYDVEWNRWQDLLDFLVEVGAVTEEDLGRPVGGATTTGEKVLGTIRAWGAAAQVLAKRQVARNLSRKKKG